VVVISHQSWTQSMKAAWKCSSFCDYKAFICKKCFWM